MGPAQVAPAEVECEHRFHGGHIGLPRWRQRR